METAAETVLTGLVNQRDALLVSGTLRISPKGTESLFSGAITETRRTTLRTMLSTLRTEALNILLRKKRFGIWGEAA